MDILEKIQKLKKEVRLTESSRDAGRHHLAILMSQNPLPEAPEGINIRHFIFMRNLRFYLAATGMILILGGTATSLAAERSLPGDSLYSLKIGLTEPLREALAFSKSSELNWQIEKMGRRLEEAEKLAVLGRLDEDARAVIEKGLDKTRVQADNTIAGLSSAEASRTASEMEAVLDAHGTIMLTISARAGKTEQFSLKKESQGQELLVLREQVKEMHRVAQGKRMEAEELSGQSSSSLEDARAITERTVSAPVVGVVELKGEAPGNGFEQKNSIMTTSEVEGRNEKNESADLIKEASEKLREGDYGAGLMVSNSAIRMIKREEIIKQAEEFYGISINGKAEEGGREE